MTPGERRLRAQIAANTRWSQTKDRVSALAPARDGMQRRFENQVDPDRTLPPAERAKRAESARRAHFAALALKSAKARRKKPA